MTVSKHKLDRGFTIVELLVVIVVIGILAAITIVSYTGVTARANKASAESTVNAIYSKAEIYYTDGPTSLYPANLGSMTAAAASTTYYLTGVTFSGTLLAAAPSTPNTVNWFRCGTGATDSAPTGDPANITAVTGAKVGYWDYTTPAIAYKEIGKVTGTVGSKNIGCIITSAIGS